MSIERQAGEKHCHLLLQVLQLFDHILDICLLSDITPIINQLVANLQIVFHIEPTFVVKCTTKILRTLFATNHAGVVTRSETTQKGGLRDEEMVMRLHLNPPLFSQSSLYLFLDSFLDLFLGSFLDLSLDPALDQSLISYYLVAISYQLKLLFG